MVVLKVCEKSTNFICTFFFFNVFLLFLHTLLFDCMYVYVTVLNPLEQELQYTVVRCHVRAGI